MHTLPTRLSGPALIQPFVYGDERGFFAETYRQEWHAEAGIPSDLDFVQDNHSRSTRGVVRGLHFHTGVGAAKLVRCARGKIFDVVVDLRCGSPAFGQWEGFELDDERLRVLYVPIGFAHGFCVVSEQADVVYKQSNYYLPGIEASVAWDDPDIAIDWPLEGVHPTVSERDTGAPRLRELDEGQLFTYEG
jgi:dTDP-4-dehydrorhamnose 3,5-epimerase